MGGRVGFIGDVHGDVEALRWALHALRDADRVICLGDVVDGPHDSACIDLLQGRRIEVLQGNHDLWASLGFPYGNRHSDGERNWLGALPLRVEEDGWLAYHSRTETLGSETYWEHLYSEAAVRRAMEQDAQPLIFCGHTHVPCVNVIGADGTVFYVSTQQLRRTPQIVLEKERRYLVNAGRPTLCVAIYDAGAGSIEFRFS